MIEKADKVSEQYGPSHPSMRIKLILTSIIFILVALFQLPYTSHAKDTGEVIKAPVISQFPELPTGCEATSAAMLLKWAGVNVSKEEIARLLPKGNVPVNKAGRLSGDNPENVFVGDPFSKKGYGVYHRPIALAIDRYLPGRGLDLTGISFDDLLKVIDSKRPVVVWCTIGNAHPRVSQIWYGDNGEKIVWKIPEHAVLLVGYNDSNVIVNDPWKGKNCSYPKSTFKEHWEFMGKQAVTIK